MKNLVIKLLSLMLIFIFLLGTLNVNAATQTTFTAEQRALRNIAYAYYFQGKGIQYEQHRRFLNEKPEQAKDRWPIYLDCSSFVFNVYLQAFGIELQGKYLDGLYEDTRLNKTYKQLDDASKICINKNRNVIRTSGNENSYIPCYVGKLSSISHSELKDIKKLLKPGDLIVYQRSSGTGHVIIYVGNGEILHCTGQRYDYDKAIEHTDKAGIVKTTVDNSILNKESSMYLLKSNFTRFAVIRPLNAPYMKDAKLTEYAKFKNAVPNLDLFTQSSPWNLKTVNLGRTITYTICLNNRGSTTLKNLIVNEKISTYLNVNKNSFVTKYRETVNGEVKTTVVDNIAVTLDENNNLSCKVDKIAPNTQFRITYKATVKNDVNNLGKTIKSEAKVGKMVDGEKVFASSSVLKHYIGKTLTTAQRETLVEIARNYKNKSYDGKARHLIDDIYMKAFNVDVKLGNISVENMLKKIYVLNPQRTGDYNKYSFNTDTTSKTQKMLVKHLSGFYKSINSGSRYIDVDNLIAGDVIIYKKRGSDDYAIYLYLSKTEMMTMNDGKVVVRSNVQERLESLIGQDKFAVLRPSLDM